MIIKKGCQKFKTSNKQLVQKTVTWDVAANTECPSTTNVFNNGRFLSSNVTQLTLCYDAMPILKLSVVLRDTLADCMSTTLSNLDSYPGSLLVVSSTSVELCLL